MTTLLTTHYLDEAERLCDRIAVVHAGTIVALDSPKQLLARLGDDIVEVRVTGSAQAALSRLRNRGLADDDAFAIGATLTIPLHAHSSQAIVDELAAADVGTPSVAVRKPTLDDVYLQLTGASLAA
jgi:ABC-2 type transport system ATP-binding protein